MKVQNPPKTVWNKNKLIGQKLPLKPEQIWSIRVRLEMQNNIRDLALFNLALDSKLRACDLLKLTVRDVSRGEGILSRTKVIQQKTKRPVQFEITKKTKLLLQSLIDHDKLTCHDHLFKAERSVAKNRALINTSICSNR
jgi:integrase